MSLPRELLQQAHNLLDGSSNRPTQADLRRAVSAAYYALFHLLIYEASRVFVEDEDTIGMLARSYDHGKMFKVSKDFANGKLPKQLVPLHSGFDNADRKPIVDKLKSVAQSFADLQDARHEADYDLRKTYTPEEASKLLEMAERAFTDWSHIRNDDLSRIYLSCFLISDAWDKDRKSDQSRPKKSPPSGEPPR